MCEYYVVAVDAARARFFRLENVDVPEFESGPNLVEDGALTNPESEMAGRDVFTSSKTGRARPARGQSPISYDDHRAKHMVEFDRRFARKISRESLKRAKRSGARCVVLAADPQMLGHLRPVLDEITRNGIELREFARDVSKLPALEVQQRLAAQELIPPRKGPVAH
jgi:protein required for attachment to host cells